MSPENKNQPDLKNDALQKDVERVVKMLSKAFGSTQFIEYFSPFTAAKNRIDGTKADEGKK